jgi:HK97 family phage prohead protease
MPVAPIHHTPIDSTGAWDGPAAEKAFDKKAGDFVKFYAWVDEGETDLAADGGDKEDGWGPHHDVNADGQPGDANMAGVEAAMAALNGAQGGAGRIPDGDRAGVHAHLAAHYVDAGVEADKIPELKSGKSARSERRRQMPATSAERRDAALSFGDIESRVYECIVATYAPKNEDGEPGWFDIWVQDLGTDWVVFQSWETTPGVGLYQQSYSIDGDGLVALTGDPVRVDEVSTYVPVPVETKSADPAPAGLTPLAKTTAAVAGRAKKPRHRSGPAIAREFRQVITHPEVRSVTDDAGNPQIVVTGSPIVYETPTTITDCFGDFSETIHAGAATAVLGATPDVRFLFNHDGLPLARTVSGTLTLTDTATALLCEARLDARQQLANDLAIAIERGDVSQMSFGFVVAPAGDAWSDDWCTRDIWAFEELFDVSAVTYPAYKTTSVEIAQRMMTAAPVQSRTRLRRMWSVAREVREGKVLSADNAAMLQTALEALHAADDIDLVGIARTLEDVDKALDAGQAGIAGVLDVANPDGDAADENIELVPSDDPGGDDPDAEQDSEDVSGSDAEGDDGSAGSGDTVAPGAEDGTGSRSAGTDPAVELEVMRMRSAAVAHRRKIAGLGQQAAA